MQAPASGIIPSEQQSSSAQQQNNPAHLQKKPRNHSELEARPAPLFSKVGLGNAAIAPNHKKADAADDKVTDILDDREILAEKN